MSAEDTRGAYRIKVTTGISSTIAVEGPYGVMVSLFILIDTLDVSKYDAYKEKAKAPAARCEAYHLSYGLPINEQVEYIFGWSPGDSPITKDGATTVKDAASSELHLCIALVCTP